MSASSQHQTVDVFLVSVFQSLDGTDRAEFSMPTLSPEDAGRLFGVVLAELRQIGFTNARVAVAEAGITGVNVPEQYWAPFFAEVDAAFHRLGPDGQLSALRILASRLGEHENIQKLFAQHGFQFVDGTFVPIALIDQREARYLPKSSASELAKAMKRLVEDDETGAITAACGAVDALMADIYRSHRLGDPGRVAFAAKVSTAGAHLGIFEDTKAELVYIGIDAEKAERIVTHMRKATIHAAEMLQTIRSTMGDVHGSKPTLRRTAYDAIKWASAICGLFEGR